MLIHRFLRKSRPLYLLIESHYLRHPGLEAVASRFDLKKIAVIPESRGMILFQVRQRE